MFSGLVPIPTATCAAQQPACSGRRCAPPVDLAKHNEIALEIARQGIVLLENDGVLPLPTGKKMKIAVIGGHAQEGIIAGTGSGAVNPVGGYAGVVKIGGAGIMGGGRNMFLYAPSPLAELKKALPDAQFDFDPGYTPTEAALTEDLSEDLRDAWERLRETAVEFGDQRIYASGTCIMFSRESCYFFVRPRRSSLEVCVFLGRALQAPQVRGPNPRPRPRSRTS